MAELEKAAEWENHVEKRNADPPKPGDPNNPSRKPEKFEMPLLGPMEKRKNNPQHRMMFERMIKSKGFEYE